MKAIVFDSNAWFFLRGREAAMSTMTLSGEYFYHFSTEGPVGMEISRSDLSSLQHFLKILAHQS